MHSLVDDYRRLAYSEVLPDEKGTDLRGVPGPRGGLLRRAWHRPGSRELMTDNAWAYKQSLREV